LRYVKKPLDEWEQRKSSELAEAIAADANRDKVDRMRLRKLQEKAAAAEDADGRRGFTLEAEQLAASLATRARIVAPELYLCSATVARLEEKLGEQGGRFALFTDEASALEA